MVEIIVAANLVAIKVVIDTVTLVIIVAMDAVVTEALETVPPRWAGHLQSVP